MLAGLANTVVMQEGIEVLVAQPLVYQLAHTIFGQADKIRELLECKARPAVDVLDLQKAVQPDQGLSGFCGRRRDRNTRPLDGLQWHADVMVCGEDQQEERNGQIGGDQRQVGVVVGDRVLRDQYP